jgi:hypothetical protein
VSGRFVCIEYSAVQSDGRWYVATRNSETGREGFVGRNRPDFWDTLEEAYEVAFRLNTSIANNPNYRPSSLASGLFR